MIINGAENFRAHQWNHQFSNYENDNANNSSVGRKNSSGSSCSDFEQLTANPRFSRKVQINTGILNPKEVQKYNFSCDLKSMLAFQKQIQTSLDSYNKSQRPQVRKTVLQIQEFDENQQYYIEELRNELQYDESMNYKPKSEILINSMIADSLISEDWIVPLNQQEKQEDYYFGEHYQNYQNDQSQYIEDNYNEYKEQRENNEFNEEYYGEEEQDDYYNQDEEYYYNENQEDYYNEDGQYYEVTDQNQDNDKNHNQNQNYRDNHEYIEMQNGTSRSLRNNGFINMEKPKPERMLIDSAPPHNQSSPTLQIDDQFINNIYNFSSSSTTQQQQQQIKLLPQLFSGQQQTSNVNVFGGVNININIKQKKSKLVEDIEDGEILEEFDYEEFKEQPYKRRKRSNNSKPKEQINQDDEEIFEIPRNEFAQSILKKNQNLQNLVEVREEKVMENFKENISGQSLTQLISQIQEPKYHQGNLREVIDVSKQEDLNLQKIQAEKDMDSMLSGYGRINKRKHEMNDFKDYQHSNSSFKLKSSQKTHNFKASIRKYQDSPDNKSKINNKSHLNHKEVRKSKHEKTTIKQNIVKDFEMQQQIQTESTLLGKYNQRKIVDSHQQESGCRGKIKEQKLLIKEQQKMEKKKENQQKDATNQVRVVQNIWSGKDETAIRQWSDSED
eukprot:403376454